MANQRPAAGPASVLNWAIMPTPSTLGTKGLTLLLSAAVGSRFVPKLASQNCRSSRKITGKSSAGRASSAAQRLCTNTAASTSSANTATPMIEIDFSKVAASASGRMPM